MIFPGCPDGVAAAAAARPDTREIAGTVLRCLASAGTRAPRAACYGKESQLNENRGEGRAPPLAPFDVAARRLPLVDDRVSRGDRFPRRRR
ncbi:hypothetical protein MRX96_013936 [Rhipicephalus microplus]